MYKSKFLKTQEETSQVSEEVAETKICKAPVLPREYNL